jgi:enoyl-CoA hydratase
VALGQFKRGKSLNLTDALKLEFRLASHVIATHDYREGVSARMAGKGRVPNWQPATLDMVDDAAIERLFTTPAEDELELKELKPGL